MTEQTESAEVEAARAAATLYDEVRAAVIAEPIGSLARRLHTALGNLAHAVLTSEPAAAEARGAERVLTAVMREAPALNSELRYDGTEDPQMAAYVEGYKDAWTAADNAARAAATGGGS